VLKGLFLLALIALAIYLVVRMAQRGGTSGTAVRRPSPPPAPRRPIAPDDDLDFLRDLERKRRHPDDPEP
jgi:hypothetical protein